MKRSISIAVLLLGLALPVGAAANGVATPATVIVANGGSANVTGMHAVKRDLRLASEFWTVERPALESPCAATQVMVTQMEDGIGDNDELVPAAEVWAETALGGCTIDVAPVAWALGTSGNSGTSYMLCILIAHEYGHTLGLPDTESVPMMSNNWARRDDPLCDRAVYGWHWTLHKDREWIAANRHGIRMARREATRQVDEDEVTAAASGSSTTATTSTVPPAPAAPPVQAPSGTTTTVPPTPSPDLGAAAPTSPSTS